MQHHLLLHGPRRTLPLLTALLLGCSLRLCPAAEPYKVLHVVQTPGTGGIDYVYADNSGAKLYVPRGSEILAFDLETLKPAGSITNAKARGVAVDPGSHHGFCSSSPVIMWDTATLARLKTIPIAGRPDSILFEPLTERVYVFSHAQPNVTILDGKTGTVAGTLDLGGEPEQGISDGQGHVYVALEDKNSVAVVDVKELKVTARYDLGEKGGAPVGVALDVANKVLFVFCRKPTNAVILGADSGRILAVLPIGQGTDSGVFNATTKEAFSSQGDGTMTVIRETGPTQFEVAQTVRTKPKAKTCTLNTRKNEIILITTEPAAGAPAGGAGNASLLDIIVVGR